MKNNRTGIGVGVLIFIIGWSLVTGSVLSLVDTKYHPLMLVIVPLAGIVILTLFFWLTRSAPNGTHTTTQDKADIFANDARVQALRNKREFKEFSASDLPSYARERMALNARIIVVNLLTWTKVGDTEIKILETSSDMDNQYAKVQVQKHKPEWLMIWATIVPGTNVMIHPWYVGDGSGPVFLAFEAITQPQLL